MDPIIEKHRIASLLIKEKMLGLTLAEQKILDSWCQADPRHETIYKRLSQKKFSADMERYRQIEMLPAIENYRKRYSRPKKVRRLNHWYHAAAVAALLVIGISTFLLYQRNTPSPQELPAFQGSKAILVLNDGSTIDLSAQKHTDIVTTENITILNSGSELQYFAPGEADIPEDIHYNELIVPKGGEFMLQLADGTKVWLNSQSELKYPMVFDKTKREVYLNGEAYFEVAKNANCPFHVIAKDNIDVEVLGTSFNVRSYPDETSVETVLEEGKVSMSRGEDKVILTPGERGVYDPGKRIQVNGVDTELYTAWRMGRYIFMNEKVEDILKQLTRWYDIEVFYRNEEAKSVMISGDVRRYDNINILLEAMEISGGVHFELNGKTLVVSYNN